MRQSSLKLVGQQINQFIVLRDTGERYHSQIVWECECLECNKKFTVPSGKLKSIKNCGCKNNQKIYFEPGTRFGKLIVISATGDSSPHGDKLWLCKCDCGNELKVCATNLKHHKSMSCGKCVRHKPLEGLHFGKLVVIEPTPKRTSSNGIVWKCKCDCGNVCEVSANNLLWGGTMSCGCLTQSSGEYYIEQILKQHNIIYKKEFSFNDLMYEKALRYDFAIFNTEDDVIPTQLIEYDGIQHFQENNFFKDTLEDIQKRDALKNVYAKEHSIPLIRIPYTTPLYDITLDLLLQNNGVRK